MSVLKTRGPVCTKFGGDIVRSSLHTEFKTGEDILLGFQATVAQTRTLLSDKAKNRYLLTPCKITGGLGEISIHDRTCGKHILMGGLSAAAENLSLIHI